MKKVMVTGSRDWSDIDLINNKLREIYIELGSPENVLLLSGGCRGADSLAESIWELNGLPVQRFPADWDKYGKAAGPIRNRQMVDESPDVVIAFPLGDSVGTRGAIRMAQSAGLDVRVFEAV